MDTIRVNHIAIAESLEPGELQTGTQLHDYLLGLLPDIGYPIGVSLHLVRSRQGLMDWIDQLTREAYRGSRPIVHVEAHGSPELGLELADGSMISWDDFSTALAPLNEATQFNLVVTVAACFGIDIIRGISMRRRAPALVVMGPSAELKEWEVLGRFREFYGTLVRTLDVHQAMAAATSTALSKGSMAIVGVDQWFETIVLRYLENETDSKAIKQGVMKQYQRLKARGIAVNLRALKRSHVKAVPAVLLHYFETYFMFNEIPACRERFAPLENRFHAKIEHQFGSGAVASARAFLAANSPDQ